MNYGKSSAPNQPTILEPPLQQKPKNLLFWSTSEPLADGLLKAWPLDFSKSAKSEKRAEVLYGWASWATTKAKLCPSTSAPISHPNLPPERLEGSDKNNTLGVVPSETSCGQVKFEDTRGVAPFPHLSAPPASPLARSVSRRSPNIEPPPLRDQKRVTRT